MELSDRINFQAYRLAIGPSTGWEQFLTADEMNLENGEHAESTKSYVDAALQACRDLTGEES